MVFVREWIANDLMARRRLDDIEFDCAFAQKLKVFLRPADVFSHEQIDVLKETSIRRRHRR